VFAYREAEQRSAFFREVARQVGELPTVETVGAVGPLPLSGTGNGSAPFALDAGDEDAWVNNQAVYHSVIPGFFEAMRMDLVSGRTFGDLDNEPEAEPVVIIDRKLAESQFGDADPVGRTIYIASASLVPAQAEAEPARIVGVVENVSFDELGAESRQTIYRPHVMTGGYLLDFTVRTAGDPMAIAAGVRDVARKVDPALPVLRVRPMSEYVAEAMAPTRFILVMLVIFAGVAVVLAAIGLYGVLSYVVRQRYREIGIRIALGAADADIIRLMLSDGLRLAVTGVALGVGTAFLMSRSISGLLYGVTATDPLTYAAIAILLLLVATAATLVPALRAAAVPPSVALRAD
jgi:putative ABC transport system permease protein